MDMQDYSKMSIEELLEVKNTLENKVAKYNNLQLAKKVSL